MPLPTFLLIGAPRAGTTSLHHWLGRHPDVCVSRPKETQFLSLEYHRGTDHYASYFAHHAGEPAVGESTPVYLTLPHVPARVAATLPGVRLLAVLREPVQQAFSSWWLLRSMGAERRDFATAVDDELGLPPLRAEDAEAYWRGLLRDSRAGRPVDGARYLMTGYYLANLQRYLAHVDPAQLTVLLHEDLRRTPRQALARVADAVGVDLDRAPSPALPRANRAVGPVEAWTRRRVAGLPSARIRQAAARAAGRLDRSGPPRVDPALRAELVAHFAAANEGLDDLLGRDLSAWARVPTTAS